jgi:sugar phosphate isomerase/epimerase
MTTRDPFSRRTFLKVVAAVPVAAAAAAGSHIPIGLELYSVRDQLKKDLMGTVASVAKMGYECVEFFAPYFDWTTDYAKQVRKQLDDLKIRCYSTHNDLNSLTGNGIDKAVELNKTIGSRYLVVASPGKVTSLDGWKGLADKLNTLNQALQGHDLHAGYHNHVDEWKAIDGKVPMEVIADNTDKSVMLQLDVGHCLAGGGNPVAWINSHPGRTRSLHLKDWSPKEGYRVLFGEGIAPWKEIFAAAETKGGAEFYLIEQEESDFPPMETVDRCLVAYRNMRG